MYRFSGMRSCIQMYSGEISSFLIPDNRITPRACDNNVGIFFSRRLLFKKKRVDVYKSVTCFNAENAFGRIVLKFHEEFGNSKPRQRCQIMNNAVDRFRDTCHRSALNEGRYAKTDIHFGIFSSFIFRQ